MAAMIPFAVESFALHPMFEQERRKTERLLVTPPITAQVEQRSVRVINIGTLGTTIEHDSPLVGGQQKLKFPWDGEEIVVDCTIVHSKASGPNIFSTCLSFVGGEPPALRRVIEALPDRDEMERLVTLVPHSNLINALTHPDSLFAAIPT